MKKRNIITIFSVLALASLMLSAVAFASDGEHDSSNTKQYVRYIVDDSGVKKVTDKEFSAKFGPDPVARSLGIAMETATDAEIKSEKPMLHFYINDDGIYKLDEAQYEEVTDRHNLCEIVKRDRLEPVSQEVNYSEQELSECVVPSAQRTKGSWSINSVVEKGYRVTYSMPGGGYFVVGDGEQITCSIGPNQACILTVGAIGTKSFEIMNEVDMSSYYGITIGTDTKGTYKFYCANRNNDFDITVDGGIVVR